MFRMLRLSVNFLCYYVFIEENLLLLENTHKMTHKVLTKLSQNASKKWMLGLCT